VNLKPTRQDLTGLRFGALTVLRPDGKTTYENMIWRCICDCGNIVNKPGQYLKRKQKAIVSCGCIQPVKSIWQDITGNRYGRLTVLGAEGTNKRGEFMWKCKCDCGTIKIFHGTSIKYGKTMSCGCYHREVISGLNNYQAQRTMTETGGLYVSSKNVWYQRAMGILKRCRDYNIPTDFDNITELATYMKNIAPEKCPALDKNFIDGTKYDHEYSPSVDRIDPKLGYTRDNIQIISHRANKMKNDASNDEQLKFVTGIAKKHGYKLVKQTEKRA